jgi:DNA-binding MarR family transcriptional regulator
MAFDDAGRFVIASGRSMERQGQERFKPYGLTVSDVAPLLRLVHLGPMTPGDLLDSSLLLTSEPVASHSIKRLESAGLVTRSPHPQDGRKVIVEATERGRGLEGEFHQHVAEIQDGFFSPLTERELAQLTELLGRCLLNRLELPPEASVWL